MELLPPGLPPDVAVWGPIFYIKHSTSFCRRGSDRSVPLTFREESESARVKLDIMAPFTHVLPRKEKGTIGFNLLC